MHTLVICKQRKEYGHTWYQMSFLRQGIIRLHKFKLKLYLYIFRTTVQSVRNIFSVENGYRLSDDQ